MSMESEAAARMGEPVRHTTVVSHKGMGKAVFTAGMARQLTGVSGAIAAERLMAGASDPTALKGYMVMALGETHLGFLKAKNGLLRKSAGELLAQFPLADIAGFELGGGMLTSPLDITLGDGTVLNLEVPKANKGGAARIGEALKGA